MTQASIKILDGGLGTSLEDKYGIRFDDSTPLWSSHLLLSAEGRDILLACHGDFVGAGADVLLTATYQLSSEGLRRTRTEEFPEGVPGWEEHDYSAVALEIADRARARARARATAAAAAAAAQDAGIRGRAVELALSCGPYGSCMTPSQEYTGRYDDDFDDRQRLCDWHVDRLGLHTRTHELWSDRQEHHPTRLGYVAFETLPRLDEVEAVRLAMGRASPAGSLPERFWISCVFPGEGDVLPDGSSVEQVVGAMLGPLGAMRGEPTPVPWGIGINCTKLHKLGGLVEKFEDAVAKMKSRGVVDKVPTLVLYPDGTNGEVYNTTTKRWELSEKREVEEGDEGEEAQKATLVSAPLHLSQLGLIEGCSLPSLVDADRLRETVALGYPTC